MVDAVGREQPAAARNTRPASRGGDQGNHPDRSPPIVPEKTKEPEEKAEKGSFLPKFISWFRGNPNRRRAKTRRKPEAIRSAQRAGAAGAETNRRDEARKDANRPNREPKEARPTQGKPAREENHEARESQKGSTRAVGRQREPRPEKKESQSPVVEVKEVLPRPTAPKTRPPSAKAECGAVVAAVVVAVVANGASALRTGLERNRPKSAETPR